jgi:predicted  nucleic acid-binding Zn-ribbon protein
MNIEGVKKPVKYSLWFKREATKLSKLRKDIDGLRVEHQAVLQDIEDGEEYAKDLEESICELDKQLAASRRELARRFATYDANFRHDALLDPSLLD